MTDKKTDQTPVAAEGRCKDSPWLNADQNDAEHDKHGCKAPDAPIVETHTCPTCGHEC